MMKKTLLILAVVLSSASAFAADETPRLDQRQENQERRIENGVESGQLTTREAARMEHAQDRLDANEAKAKADGKVTARERRRLQHEAQVNSARIAKQKHDGQGQRTRHAGGGGGAR